MAEKVVVPKNTHKMEDWTTGRAQFALRLRCRFTDVLVAVGSPWSFAWTGGWRSARPASMIDSELKPRFNRTLRRPSTKNVSITAVFKAVAIMEIYKVLRSPTPSRKTPGDNLRLSKSSGGVGRCPDKYDPENLHHKRKISKRNRRKMFGEI